MEGVDWIRLVYDSKKCRAVVNTVLNILVPWNRLLLAKEIIVSKTLFIVTNDA